MCHQRSPSTVNSRKVTKSPATSKPPRSAGKEINLLARDCRGICKSDGWPPGSPGGAAWLAAPPGSGGRNKGVFVEFRGISFDVRHPRFDLWFSTLGFSFPVSRFYFPV